MSKNERWVMRPRLTRDELLFLARALFHYAGYMAAKQREMQNREYKIAEFRQVMFTQDARKGAELLRREKALYRLDQQNHYYTQERVSTLLAKRFTHLANNGKVIHSASKTLSALKRVLDN